MAFSWASAWNAAWQEGAASTIWVLRSKTEMSSIHRWIIVEGTDRTGNCGQTGATDRVLHPVEPLAIRLTVAGLLVYWCMLRGGRGLLKQVSAPFDQGTLIIFLP